MKRNAKFFDLSKAIPEAWAMQWAERERMQREDRGFRGSETYVTAGDVVNQVRENAACDFEGKPRRVAWGRGSSGVRITGVGDLLGHVREWLTREVRAGRLTAHNFDRGHCSGARFRPAGVGLSDSEKRTLTAKAKRRENPREAPRHFGHGRALCVRAQHAAQDRYGFGRRLWILSTEVRADVTCPRCANLLKAMPEGFEVRRLEFSDFERWVAAAHAEGADVKLVKKEKFYSRYEAKAKATGRLVGTFVTGSSPRGAVATFAKKEVDHA